MAAELLYEGLTGKIRQAAFEAHRYFGNGFLEFKRIAYSQKLAENGELPCDKSEGTS